MERGGEAIEFARKSSILTLPLLSRSPGYVEGGEKKEGEEGWTGSLLTSFACIVPTCPEPPRQAREKEKKEEGRG